MLDRESRERAGPIGRALDLGCGRGQYTAELARRGWDAVGVDVVPAAIEQARRQAQQTATYFIADVTDLTSARLGGSFDLFLDVGCFQGLTQEQRQAEGHGVTALARPGATLLILAFGPTRLWTAFGAASQEDVQMAFRDWELLSAELATTVGLGWPLNSTAPRWYRLRRSA